MKTDLAIAQSRELLRVTEIAESMSVPADQLELYGKYKAKMPIDLIDEERVKESKLILVTAMTPTPAGEG